MKPHTPDKRTAWIASLLCAVVVVILMAVGCFGGGDEGSSNGDGTVPDGGGSVSSVPEVTTTMVAAIDPLSSFKSKDPFVPQAQLTTTTAAPSTTAYTTTTLAPTTTVYVPPTITHRLTVTGFSPNGNDWVSFSIDGTLFTEVEPGPGLFIGPWGIVQVDGVADYWAAFKVAYSNALYLQEGTTGTWSE